MAIVESKTKAPYSAPQLTEHGTIRDITKTAPSPTSPADGVTGYTS